MSDLMRLAKWSAFVEFSPAPLNSNPCCKVNELRFIDLTLIFFSTVFGSRKKNVSSKKHEIWVTNGLSFFRSQNCFGWSKYFASDKKRMIFL